jgi:two-component system, OmpR family, phosphate regulon sensor histidine kinase PhoR
VSGERILVVDDSMEMRDFLSNGILKREGYTVESARNGIEGLERAASMNPDLIITDLSMPEMDGLMMLEELRRRRLNMPAILMTAEGSEDIAVRALRVGVMDYFVKPFDPMEMLDAVVRILGATRIGAMRTGVPDQKRLQALNTLIAIGKSITSLLDLETILSRVVDAAVYLSNTEEGTLMLVDPGTGDLYMRASKNVDEGMRQLRLKVEDSLAGRVVSTGEPLLVSGEGLQKIKTAFLVQSLLYVPLKFAGRVIGVLGVHNRLKQATISPEAVGSVTALADYAAIAIANAQLYHEADSERSKLGRILQQTEDAVLLVSESGRVALANPVAREFLNKAEGKAAGKSLRDITDNQQLIDLIESPIEPGKAGVVQGEVQLEARTFNGHVSHIPGIGRMVVMQDITEFKELDRIKNELVTMVSHDLRSPLTAILSYIELLGRVGELNDQQQEFTRQARQSVYAITSLINDLLDVGRIEAGMDKQREPVAIDQIARQIADGARKQAGLKQQRFLFTTEDNLPLVYGNSTRLRQVFSNLIDNAIKYTPDGGEISISLFSESDQIVAVISDTGIGIPVDAQPHIFEKFYRVKDIANTHVGTGLGLNIVQQVVESHDGRIWVQSVPEQGTIFTLMFPPYNPAEARPTTQGMG